MGDLIVEQTTKEIGRLLDDLDVIRNGISVFNPEEWAEQGYKPEAVYEAVRYLRNQLGSGFRIIDDWHKLMDGRQVESSEIPGIADAS